MTPKHPGDPSDRTVFASLGTPIEPPVTMMIYAHTGMTEQTEALRKLGEVFGSIG